MNKNIHCKITIQCDIYPSEDSKKINSLLYNITPDGSIKTSDGVATIHSDDMHILDKIQNTINSKKNHNTYLRVIKRNLTDDSTWFYLNKQAASAGNIVLCNDADESPLGPIKVAIHSKQIDDIVEWLTSTPEL